jgi:ubiquinone/menaquinone biosynthesis C-methylase UbiE
MMPFLRKTDPYVLVVSMAGVKLGDQFLQIGCAHGGRLAAVAAKVGLSGRAAAVVPDQASAARVHRGAERQGVLVDVEMAPPTHLPLEDGPFDLVVIDDTGGLFTTMRAEDRGATVREVLRVLRPGGRVMVIGTVPREGLGAFFTRAQSGPPFDPQPALMADGFTLTRRLGEREGLRFTEGVKPHTTAST